MTCLENRSDTIIMPHSKYHIDYLNDLFQALPQGNLPMNLSEYDGFATGILVCPVDIEPSEWLPHVWGTTRDGHFPDQRTAEGTIDALLAHFEVVAADMATLSQIQPIFGGIGASTPFIWEPWIDGFMRAALLRPVAWQEFFEQADEAVQSMMSFLQTLHDIYTGKSALTRVEIDAIDSAACDLIPSCILHIARRSRPDRSLPQAANASNKPGNLASRSPDPDW